MGEIILRNLTKKFGHVTAIRDLNVEIKNGEIVSFLGPSGCGKTTTLRLIAGLERPTDGEIYIDGELVSSKKTLVPPERRNLGMVFQNYAVWPHMTVFANVAYPLRIRKIPKKEIMQRVEEMLELVGMRGYEARYPDQLSGGQQQRVALARALIVRPAALLLDEPLSNLDAKLRERMRFELMELHKNTKITVVYVTHDQAEAMVLSDRIMVMNEGTIQQVGTPLEIYRQPVNRFVADFIGVANFVDCKLLEVNDGKGTVLVGTGTILECEVSPHVSPGQRGVLFIRPESIELHTREKPGTVAGLVRRKVFLGGKIDYRIEVEGMEWRVEGDPEGTIREGDRVYLLVKRARFIPE
ncbi:MAG TPA: ABC transporter ATP-binding protein [Desulfobacterales bacterium]|nr:ABC transporter ATP-binding protein [Desulfobacterales bacterium]